MCIRDRQMANKQFGPAANVHIDRPHQIINSAKVVINSTNSSLGHWRQDVSRIGNNLSLGGKASLEIMIRSSDRVIANSSYSAEEVNSEKVLLGQPFDARMRSEL